MSSSPFLPSSTPTIATRSTITGLISAAVMPIAIVLATSGLILGSALAVAFFTDAQFPQFTRDPAAVTNTSPFIGVISNIGTWVWSGAATICFLTWLMRRRLDTHPSASRFFLSSALFTTLLLADDGLMIHDRLLEEGWGVSERVIYPVYMAIAAAWLWWNRRAILRTNFVLFILAVVCFAVAIIGDVADAFEHDAVHYLVEDGMKFVGILLWFAYFLTAALKYLSPTEHVTP